MCNGHKNSGIARFIVMKKKTTVDGPDGNAYYCHDRRCSERVFERRHSGGGSVMLWAVYSSKGLSGICFLNERLNGSTYVEVLENCLILFSYYTNGTKPNSFVFVPDEARVHINNVVKNKLQSNNISTMNWPA